MAEILRQLFNEAAEPIGNGASKQEVLDRGLLHGVAHVWIWRKGTNEPEVLLQVRAHDKATWPGRYDISAAGHLDQGESPIQAAIRETWEELGLAIKRSGLVFLFRNRAMMQVPETRWVENEFQWIYAYNAGDERLRRTSAEVDDIAWKKLSEVRDIIDNQPQELVYGRQYFEPVFIAIEQLSLQK